MISAWTKGCKTQEEKDRLQSTLLGSKIAFNRLGELLQEEIDELNKSEIDIKNYDNPNWINLQAHKNGQRSSLQKILKLINLDQG